MLLSKTNEIVYMVVKTNQKHICQHFFLHQTTNYKFNASWTCDRKIDRS